MIEITTTCARCGADFTPSHSDYVRGIWRVCQRCRDGPNPLVSGVIEGDAKRLQGKINGPNCQVGRKQP